MLWVISCTDKPNIEDVHQPALEAHNKYLDPTTEMSEGKRILIGRMAATLGWDNLWYDTMPKARFNIWQFPTEYRNTPATKPMSYDPLVAYVTAKELGL